MPVCAEGGANGMSLGRRVLVPVANPASVGPLLELAVALCDADGEVIPLTVVDRDADPGAVAAAEHGLAQADAVVSERGGLSSSRLVRGRSTAEGVLSAIREASATLVVMGWRGRSSTTTVFGELIDSVVGRSSVPLAVVRLGATPFGRVLLPVSPDHLLPGGGRGLGLAVRLARSLGRHLEEPATVLRTGNTEVPLPEDVVGLSDRVHHDPRRTHLAVAAAARADDAIVAPVAPTVSGLRAATTHLAWAAPDATLLVAVDPGPTESGIVEAVGSAGAPAPRRPHRQTTEVEIVVTASGLEPGRLTSRGLARLLRPLGPARSAHEDVAAGAPEEGTSAPTRRRARPVTSPATARPGVAASVRLRASTTNQALALVMEELHDAPELRGAEITYDLRHSSPAVAVVHGDLAVRTLPPGELEVLRSRPESEPEPGRLSPPSSRGPHSLR
jgi:hypothetical protein